MSLTIDLRAWRADRNITSSNYRVYFENIVEELLEPLYEKKTIEYFKEEIMDKYYPTIVRAKEDDVLDAIQDIQVFSINEFECMGYDNIKGNEEVFKEINSRQQCPLQAQRDWYGEKWKKNTNQPKETLYKADFRKCK
jgi:hypothetical protein